MFTEPPDYEIIILSMVHVMTDLKKRHKIYKRWKQIEKGGGG